MKESSYAGYNKNELISMVLKLEELKEHLVRQKINADVFISELKNKIEGLENKIEELEKGTKKRDKVGRPSLSEETIKEIKKLRGKGLTIREISNKLRISIGVVAKYNLDHK